TARLYAIKHRECTSDRDIVLVAAVDLDRSQRAMLDQVADRVTALVFGPQEEMAEFDEHGCLSAAAWNDMPVAVERDQIAVVDGPAQQADAVVAALANWNDTLAADEVTIGAADESVVPLVEQRLAEAELAARFGAGTPLDRLGTVQLLELLADYLERGQFGDLAALARHPDIGVWLARQGVDGDYLSALDRFQSQQLPAAIDHEGQRGEKQGGAAVAISRRLSNLVAPLAGESRPLGDWAEPILNLIASVYGERQFDRSLDEDREVLEVCQAVSACIESFRALDAAQGSPAERLSPRVTGAVALRLVCERIAGERLPPPAMPGAVEVLGWLELPLDDAAGLVVTGLNEGFVPSGGNADLFLPDRLRGALGLIDNDRRYARDNYALNLLAASRRLKLVAGRRGLDGEPLVPSRLLFACAEPERTARARLYFDPAATGGPHVVLSGALRAGRRASSFVVPPPVPLSDNVISVRVTELRDYLVCPYRYYLRHRLSLQPLADEAEELAANDFGSLIHAVLARFAGDERLRDATDAELLETGLNAILDTVLEESFGSTVLAAVRVQGEQIRGRLAAFARWQADWRTKGWRIRDAEMEVNAAHKICLPGAGQGSGHRDEPVYLRGRIDRIDVHDASGETIVFDYKTGDGNARGGQQTPEKAHRNSAGEWTDLQLPLYRHLVRAIGVEGSVRLGYILLPKDTSKVAESLADWDESLLATADARAAEVIAHIMAENFWPLASDDKPATWFPEFAAICQDDMLLVGTAGDDEDDEEVTP
ncbi:MAG TPA: PD-(D/E)XK nuclease family protein, partial [Pirellulales bacterium]|nr:PD-(D/E)XK nuclease family protein [Pirellulales bacterium]